MTPERWKRVEELFHAAGARPSAERAAFLAVAVRDDDVAAARGRIAAERDRCRPTGFSTRHPRADRQPGVDITPPP